MVVLNATDQIDGKSYADLVAQWWGVFYGISLKTNPALSDKTGTLQPSGAQSGNTVFLFGTGGDSTKRTVNLKKGQFVFAPLVNGSNWYIKGDTCDPTYIPAKGQTDIDFLKSGISAPYDAPVSLVATLDGTTIYPDLKKQRVQTAIFDVLVHPDYTAKNCDWRPKKAICYSDGYWVGFKPTVGTHRFVLAGKIKYDAQNGFGNQVIYTLNVTE